METRNIIDKRGSLKKEGRSEVNRPRESRVEFRTEESLRKGLVGSISTTDGRGSVNYLEGELNRNNIVTKSFTPDVGTPLESEKFPYVLLLA